MMDDVIENTDWCFDLMQVEDYDKNLSFSLERLYKILDEEPAPTYSVSSDLPEVSHLEKLDFQRDHDAFHPHSEPGPSEMGNSKSLDGSQCTQPLFGHPIQHNGIYDRLNGPCYNESVDGKNRSTSQHDSYSDSFESYVTGDANFHQLQNKSTNCRFFLGSADSCHHINPHHIEFASNTDLDVPRDTPENPDGSAHRKLMENYGSVSERCCEITMDTLPYSTVHNGSIHTSFVACMPEDPILSQQYKVGPEVNYKGTVNYSHDVKNSSLAAPGDFMVRAEAVLRQNLSARARSLSHDEATLVRGQNRKGAWSFLSKDSVKSTLQGQSLHNSLLADPVVDVDELLCCSSCAQPCNCGDMVMVNESSTDSSPLPYDEKTMLHNLDGSATKNGKLSSNCKMSLQKEKQKSLLKEKKQPLISTIQQLHSVFKVSKAVSQCNPSTKNSNLDDDTDLFILDDISDPVPSAPSLALENSQPMSHCFRDYHDGSGILRTRPDDERLTLRLALQDISQTKAEISPPDGVLAVPLLRHQRIALSWMIQKETAGLNCSGGILADDQGLGKTISTIALILTERSPSFSCSVSRKKCEFEPLNLDDEEDGNDTIMLENSRTNQPLNFGPRTHVKLENIDCSLVPVKGRPAAGTLVVCPTSVLRQWADELQNKITSKAKFSFLVYHGSNRTKDPYELAKYDVVITTYAIVSMEVPKQPLVDKDEMEKGKYNGYNVLTSHKRKESSSTNSRNSRQKITSDNSVLEFAHRPLAKVGWFRIILDEAQSIKNHRTQVARACWGLRAKRRWCLSGTPIQNAIDDLYSYFRFLRYEPYAVYKYFCSTIKNPISRNPTNGYKKLQAVLKTVMLRRTKGTLLDGEPIITLPPKTVTLKKVDFSEEERKFYLALEAESREQFKVYAAAGTVKQNYVNILLMLLRLRQACDHPLLVKGQDMSSVWKSSLETAKKLQKDKIMNLLSCLEACLAICTICNDPPEDAVVSICGHVFCNQCICEHLTGDDSICPSVKCIDKLNAESVFSMDTLRRCLSEQPLPDFSSDNFIFDAEYGLKVSQESLCSSSSKIRAALEILHSLPLSKNSPSLCESMKPYTKSPVLLENTLDSVSSGCLSDTATVQQSNFKDSNVRHTEKAIVFSQWTRMLDLLEVSLKGSCILYRRLDGTMSVASRENAIKDFNRLPEVTVIIMSLKAASLGLNMVVACHVVLLDLWWNPTTEDQAIDRAHRIGQMRPVTVSRLTVKGTVEDRILALQEKKRKLVASAFGEDESGSQQSRLTVEDLKYLFMG